MRIGTPTHTAGLSAVGSQFINSSAARREVAGPQGRGTLPLALKDYQPKSMLHVPETHVPRSRFPSIASTVLSFVPPDCCW